MRRKEEVGTRMPPDASRMYGVTDTGQKQGEASSKDSECAADGAEGPSRRRSHAPASVALYMHALAARVRAWGGGGTLVCYAEDWRSPGLVCEHEGGGLRVMTLSAASTLARAAISRSATSEWPR